MTLSLKEREKRYKHRQTLKRRAEMDFLTPNPRTGLWSEGEDSIVLREDISLREQAVMLNRNWLEVKKRLVLIQTLGRPTDEKCEVCGDRIFKSARIDARNGCTIGRWIIKKKYVVCSSHCAWRTPKVADGLPNALDIINAVVAGRPIFSDRLKIQLATKTREYSNRPGLQYADERDGVLTLEPSANGFRLVSIDDGLFIELKAGTNIYEQINNCRGPHQSWTRKVSA